MKRFIIDFIIAFFIIIGIFGLSGSNDDNIDIPSYDSEVEDENDKIENIKDYEGNLVNRISFKINNIIQVIADFGFDKFKDILKAFLE